jgi:hypothetical protein
MKRQSRDYFSYLLRAWGTGHGENGPWRASLECPLTGERWTFASLEECWAFLQATIAAAEYTKQAAQTDSQGGNQCAS